MPFDATNAPFNPSTSPDFHQRLAIAAARPRAQRAASRPRPGDERLYRWHAFKDDILRPVLGVAISVPLGVALTFLLSFALGWLG
jgi:hypothetical protein